MAACSFLYKELCMLVNTPIANLYSEPSVGELDDQILYGEEADVLERSNGFAKIRTEYGYEGWVEERHLAIPRYDGAIMRVVTPFCTVLDIPKYQGRTVVTLPRGAKVEMTGEDNSFAQVRLIGGEKGYIRRSHIAALPGKLREAELRRAVTETAKAYLGVPYLWGWKIVRGDGLQRPVPHGILAQRRGHIPELTHGGGLSGEGDRPGQYEFG